MNRSLPALAPAIAGLAFALPAVGPGEAEAQAPVSRDFRSGMQTGFGYTAAAPDALLGAGAFHFFGATGVGVFGDWKTTSSRIEGRANHCSSLALIEECSPAWVGEQRPLDREMRDEDEFLAFNLGALYAITPEFAILAGAGAVRTNRFREYLDEGQDVSASGAYFVDVEEESGWGVGFVGGALVRAGRNLAFRFGYESGPGGMSFGAYWVLP